MTGAKLCQLSVLILVAGCATQPPKVANDGPDLVCHSEQSVGSLISKSVCTTRAQRAEEQAQLEEVRRAAESAAGDNTHPVKPTFQ
jgi:hypothetical protein